MNDEKYMRLALQAAEKACQMDEVPIGAILVQKTGEILAEAWNETISSSDPTAHAEILALRKAGKKLLNYRLPGTTLYVTIEPCVMCMGALIHARIGRLVFGAKDPKWGGAGSLYAFSEDRRFNHTIEVTSGVLEAECRDKIQHFFRIKRQQTTRLMEESEK
ncbi:tRNA adenosine(34) deaminase TadA [Desulfococcaceae bacterium OttesenSCG-928-F15]|nr:tRNA adenosine(34) deaminase TadA [Desulfococcaceae bacterium OttesenSCG-928-F15]